MTRTQADFLALLAALIWGVAFYFQKAAMDHVGPFLFLGMRSLLGAMALAPFALAETRKASAGNTSVTGFAIWGGVLFFVAAAFQQRGIVTATVTNTSFLTALYVVITPFLLWFLRQGRPGARVWLAAFVAFGGIWFLGGGTISAFSSGDILVAVSAFFWAGHMVLTSVSGKVGRPMHYTFLGFIVVAVLALVSAFTFEPVSLAAIWQAAVPIAYVGFISSAFTFALMAHVVRYIPASHAAILVSTETVFGTAAGYVMLGERLTPIGWLGAAMVIAAVLLIHLKKDAVLETH